MTMALACLSIILYKYPVNGNKARTVLGRNLLRLFKVSLFNGIEEPILVGPREKFSGDLRVSYPW